MSNTYDSLSNEEIKNNIKELQEVLRERERVINF